MLKPKTLGLWANTDKDIFWNILPEIIEWAKRKKIQIFATEKIQSDSRFNFLSCARSVKDQNTPILGIHLGDLGFLAKVTLDDIFQRLDQVAAGDFLVEKRSMLKASIDKKDKDFISYGLNDFVVSSGESHRMLISEVYVESFVITPISAHSLTSRPLVVSNKSEVRIKFSNYNQNITLITDGQLHESVDSLDIVSITNSNFEIGLIDFKDSDYFQTLRTKMGWGTRGNGES